MLTRLHYQLKYGTNWAHIATWTLETSTRLGLNRRLFGPLCMQFWGFGVTAEIMRELKRRNQAEHANNS